MTKHLIPLLVAIAVAACGSASSPAATTPAPPAPTGAAHAHDHDATGSGDATGSAVAAPEAPPKEPERGEPSPAATDPKADLLAAETSAWGSARPVFDKACATCHTSAGKKATKKKLDHFSFDSYPPRGHHTSTIGFTIRDVLGLSGKKPAMPYDKPGSVQGVDLATIRAWADAWEAAEKAGAHPASGAHHH